MLAQIDPAAGKAKDTATEFSVTGIVAAKLALPDQKVLAFIHNPGAPALAVQTDVKDGAQHIPRNVVKLTGKLGDGPFGAALVLNAGSVSVTESNKPFTSASVAGSLFKDGKAYVQAGGGWVNDSEPEAEFQGTVDRSKAMLKAVALAERFAKKC